MSSFNVRESEWVGGCLCQPVSESTCVCVRVRVYVSVSASVRQHKDLVEQVTKAANVKAKQKMRMHWRASKRNKKRASVGLALRYSLLYKHTHTHTHMGMHECGWVDATLRYSLGALVFSEMIFTFCTLCSSNWTRQVYSFLSRHMTCF